MRDAGISNGDIVIVTCSAEPKDRQIVVAMLGGDFTVKRLRQRDGRIFLGPANN